jgi:hypothetical protein
MTSEERRSFDNGIWLCASCADLIDRDELAYPAELLREWKSDAELRARDRLGRPQPRAEDAIALTATALTKAPLPFKLNAISNVHAATSEALEQLDPRFAVSTTFTGSKTTFAIQPREDVPMSFHISGAAAGEWKQQVEGLLNHGKSATLNTEGVMLKGSPLLEEVLSSLATSGGRIEISPVQRPCVIKLALVEDGHRHELDDLPAAIAAGRLSYNINGLGWAGMIAVGIEGSRSQGPNPGTFTLEVHYAKWHGRDLRHLPYFDRIDEIFSASERGAHVDFRIEVDGQRVIAGRTTIGKDPVTAQQQLALLVYTRRARTLAQTLALNVSYREAPFTSEEHRYLARCVSIAEKKRYGSTDLDQPIRLTALIAKENDELREQLRDGGEPRVLVQQEDSAPLQIFGQEVHLPRVRTTLAGIGVKVLERSIEPDGREKLVAELFRLEGFSMQREYLPSELKLAGEP